MSGQVSSWLWVDVYPQRAAQSSPNTQGLVYFVASSSCTNMRLPAGCNFASSLADENNVSMRFRYGTRILWYSDKEVALAAHPCNTARHVCAPFDFHCEGIRTLVSPTPLPGVEDYGLTVSTCKHRPGHRQGELLGAFHFDL